MLFVLEGFYAALSSACEFPTTVEPPPPPYTFFIKAALNLSIGASFSLRYSRSRGFYAVFVNLGDNGRVTYCWAFFLLSFSLNLSCCFLNCSLVTSSLILGLKLCWSTLSTRLSGICFSFSECICMRSGNLALLKLASACFLILSCLSYSYYFII